MLDWMVLLGMQKAVIIGSFLCTLMRIKGFMGTAWRLFASNFSVSEGMVVPAAHSNLCSNFTWVIGSLVSKT